MGFSGFLNACNGDGPSWCPRRRTPDPALQGWHASRSASTSRRRAGSVPGKIALLERIEAAGSISGAGRDLGMSYRRAWLLVEALNGLFDGPVVAHPDRGEPRRRGAADGELGRELVACYRDLEREAEALAADRLAGLEARLSRRSPP
jgi:molybdate transport system regulatory protein